ncbi:4-alpha-glucanotransferase [Microlunatus flavus]|uniref:4-alpha-glucanotransferase n=1 Tax=Microlunatus flavus TaxID=1036181 RepID=A0A1H9N4N6_9ACTN|nr:4-alpha-glucanotransferase [Microlunatus flavus]SER30946.1 4-alpha-glucanotransferase [Microlunatus flavus]
MSEPEQTPDPTLQALADAYGIATEYWDWQGQHVVVGRQTVEAVLAALDVDASTPEAAAQALAARELEPWTRMLPPVLALRSGRTGHVHVHVRDGDALEVWIDLETGGVWEHLHQLENWSPARHVDGPYPGGGTVGEATFEVPAALPLGYHTLRARSTGAAGDVHEAAMALIVTPSWLGFPASVGERRAWGVATQLYSVTSAQSWGVGDLVDLEDLAVWSAASSGADYVLVNPLHAAEPVPPLEPSPYLPTSRRFANPLYLRVERIPEHATAPDAVRAQTARLRDDLDARLAGVDVIDRDAAWTAKRAALRALFAVPRTPGREAAFAAYRAREGDGLRNFATWSAIATEHGPDHRTWPEDLRHPEGAAVRAWAQEHDDEVGFESWLQWVLDEQLDGAQAAALRAGMRLGVMHDLAVGVNPRGADAWSLQDTYARGITVGAPPDPYNQHGQDWSQPPWRPDRLAEAAYEPWRAMVSTILRHAGGIRVDHVIGLFRLWWIPQGLGPKAGTYVRLDHEAMVGILALEAHRSEALVVGEDLGTVEPWVREDLRGRGILGTSILWFEFDFDGDGSPLAPELWREYCLASVTTHDLPPTTAYLAGDHVRLRERLGVLTRPFEEELALDEAERAAWLDALRAHGVLAEGADVEETVRALHRYLTLTPSRLLNVALTDAVGDRRAQNQPGTTNEYPNWRVPLTDPEGRPVHLEDVFVSPRVRSLLAVFEG